MNTVLEALTCSVCLERLKDPRQLSCGHCFCLSCLEQLSLPRCCPECRSVFYEEPSVLARDYKLQQLIDILPQPCFYCKSDVETNVSACSHCQKHFCEICLAQHWRAIANKRYKVLQESLRGFETPELLRAHCQSVILESMRNARAECHRLIDVCFNENETVAINRYGRTDVKLPDVQLFFESGLKPEGFSKMASSEFYESSGKKLKECHKTLEKMYNNVVSDLRNIKAYVESMNLRNQSSFPGPEMRTFKLPEPENTADTMAGSRRCKMQAPPGIDTMVKNGLPYDINTRHQCIVAMREYENKSLEELRWEDYRIKRPTIRYSGIKKFNIPSEEGLEPLRFGHIEIPGMVLARTSATNNVRPKEKTQDAYTPAYEPSNDMATSGNRVYGNYCAPGGDHLVVSVDHGAVAFPNVKCDSLSSMLELTTLKEQEVLVASFETRREQEEDSDESL